MVIKERHTIVVRERLWKSVNFPSNFTNDGLKAWNRRIYAPRGVAERVWREIRDCGRHHATTHVTDQQTNQLQPTKISKQPQDKLDRSSGFTVFYLRTKQP